MYYELTDEFEVDAHADRAWRFFSGAENLPRITPPWLRFTINTPAPLPPIEADSILDYTIRWSGIPVKWRTRIIDWSPPHQFIDLQTRGPYVLWHHQHRFESIGQEGGQEGEQGTRCFDRVIYKLPFGPVGRITHALIVKQQLLDIFRFRRKVIGEHLGWKRALQTDVIIRPL